MKRVFKLLFIFISIVVMCSLGTVKVDAVPATITNPNIIKVIHYDKQQCPTGEETGGVCVTIDISEAAVGDLIKFKVNSNKTMWFHVIEVSSQKLTLISRDALDLYNNTYGYGNSYDSAISIIKALQYTNANKTTKFYENAIATQGVNEEFLSNFQDGVSIESYARILSAKYLFDAGCTYGAADINSSICANYLYKANDSNCTAVLTNTVVNNQRYIVTIGSNGAISVSTSKANEIVNGLCYKPVIEVDKYVANPYYNQTNSQIKTYPDLDSALDNGAQDPNGNEVSKSDVKIGENGQVFTKDGQLVYDKDGNLVFVKTDTVKVGDTLKIAYIGYIIGLLVLITGAYIIYKSIKDSEVSIEE